jgi:hypothetical protein
MAIVTGAIEAGLAGRVTLKRPVAEAVAVIGVPLLSLTATLADGEAIPQSSPHCPDCRTMWLA